MNVLARLATSPTRVKVMRRLFLGALFLAVGVDFYLVAGHLVHGRLAIENLPMSALVLGGLGALLVAGLAKGLGIILLYRPEDYYG